MSERLYHARRGKHLERALHTALAGSQRKRQARARPRFSVAQQGEHRAMLLLDRSRQHHDVACVARHQRKPALRRAHGSDRSEHPAQPSDLDAQPRAVRFVGGPPAKRPCHQDLPRHVLRPRFAQDARQREQDRTRRQRGHVACVSYAIAARVHDDGLRRQQRLDVLEEKRTLRAARNQPRGRRVQRAGCTSDLRTERGNARVARRIGRPSERRASHLYVQASNGNPPTNELMGRSQWRSQDRGVNVGEPALGFVDAANQQQPPGLEVSRMCGVDRIPVRFQCCSRGI